MRRAPTALLLALWVSAERVEARKRHAGKTQYGGMAKLSRRLPEPSMANITWHAPEKWNVENTSIVFVKMTKVGGSTVGGVVRRIADHHNLAGVAKAGYMGWRTRGCSTPGVFANHVHSAKIMPAVHRCRESGRDVFVLTWVREPLDRCLSKFYHLDVSRGNKEPTVKNKLSACGKGIAAPEDDFEGFLAPYGGASPEQTLAAYNFVGLTERFDESMVVLQDMLGLSTTDILYMTAKNSSEGQAGKMDVAWGTTIVAHPAVDQMEPEVQSLLTDPEWISQHQWQVTLHKLAGKRLDERIQAIGEAEFARRLDLYTRMQAAAHADCRQATSAGSKPVCYWNDNGCQYLCLDRVAKKFIG